MFITFDLGEIYLCSKLEEADSRTAEYLTRNQQMKQLSGYKNARLKERRVKFASAEMQ